MTKDFGKDIAGAAVTDNLGAVDRGFLKLVAYHRLMALRGYFSRDQREDGLAMCGRAR